MIDFLNKLFSEFSNGIPYLFKLLHMDNVSQLGRLDIYVIILIFSLAVLGLLLQSARLLWDGYALGKMKKKWQKMIENSRTKSSDSQDNSTYGVLSDISVPEIKEYVKWIDTLSGIPMPVKMIRDVLRLFDKKTTYVHQDFVTVYAERYQRKMQYVRVLAPMMILLGLLGTVFGLVEVVNALNDKLNSSQIHTLKDLKDSIITPTAGLSTAFTTTLYGLIGSIFLTIPIRMFLSFRNNLFMKIERFLITNLQPVLFPNQALKLEQTYDKLSSDFKATAVSLTRSYNDIFKEMSKAINEMVETLAIKVLKAQESLTTLGNISRDFKTGTENLDKSLGYIRNIHDQQAQSQKLQADFNRDLLQKLTGHSEQLKTVLGRTEDSIERLDQVTQSLTALSKSISSLADVTSQEKAQLKADLESLFKKHIEEIGHLQVEIQNILDGAISYCANDLPKAIATSLDATGNAILAEFKELSECSQNNATTLFENSMNQTVELHGKFKELLEKTIKYYEEALPASIETSLRNANSVILENYRDLLESMRTLKSEIKTAIEILETRESDVQAQWQKTHDTLRGFTDNLAESFSQEIERSTDRTLVALEQRIKTSNETEEIKQRAVLDEFQRLQNAFQNEIPKSLSNAIFQSAERVNSQTAELVAQLEASNREVGKSIDRLIQAENDNEVYRETANENLKAFTESLARSLKEDISSHCHQTISSLERVILEIGQVDSQRRDLLITALNKLQELLQKAGSDLSAGFSDGITRASESLAHSMTMLTESREKTMLVYLTELKVLMERLQVTVSQADDALKSQGNDSRKNIQELSEKFSILSKSIDNLSNSKSIDESLTTIKKSVQRMVKIMEPRPWWKPFSRRIP